MTNSGQNDPTGRQPDEARGPAPAPVEARGTPLQLGGDVLRALFTYVRGQLLIALILTAVYAPGFALLRVPWWPLFAILCGFLNLVPMFGTPLGMAFTLLAVWLAGADLTRILILAGFFVLVMTLEGYYLTPRILGRRLGLHPLYVFLALLAGGILFGFFGVLLAVPALAVLNVLWRHYRKPRRV